VASRRRQKNADEDRDVVPRHLRGPDARAIPISAARITIAPSRIAAKLAALRRWCKQHGTGT
jgi:hypothetical protein